MKNKQPIEWTEKDFDALSWNDCVVYGFKFDKFVYDDGSCDLVLDLDFIVDAKERKDSVTFVAKKAVLRFHKVSALYFNLDYEKASAGMCAFSIGEINREELRFPTVYRSYQWHIAINWPIGKIEFMAPGFTQKAWGNTYELGERLHF